MFQNLSDRLQETFNRIRGQGRLTEESIDQALREVRIALLEADVALPVVRDFLEHARERAVGQEVAQSLKPGQVLIKIVHQELVRIMGEENAALDLAAAPPVAVLVAGLQGAGKTTTIGKLAHRLKTEQKKRVMVASCDVYRPAAIEQLKTLAEQVGVSFHPSSAGDDPVEIARSARKAARNQAVDVLLLDTAGRLHVDEDMMDEVGRLHQAIEPHETLFVVDAMTGQDAANTARAFADALPLTGVVLTKTDGDARGGAALSVRQITGQPIKFMGVGEKIDQLEPFHPERVASRILGMGDVLSLVEEVEKKVDRKKADKLAKKIKKGGGFDLEDFRDQLLQMENMGGITSLMGKLPGMGNLPAGAADQVDDKATGRMVAIINSMTPQERQFPQIIRGSRKKRIATGSGQPVQEVNKLIKQHKMMSKMMKKFSGGGMAKMMKKMQGKLPKGGLPPGFPR